MMLKYIAFRERKIILIFLSLKRWKGVKNVFNIEGKIDFIKYCRVLHKEPLATMEYQTICESINTNYFGMINIAIASLPYLKNRKDIFCFLLQVPIQEVVLFKYLFVLKRLLLILYKAISQEWETLG
jgi:2-C-methyl-D-erythritol 4-phosphate cytidylyltransferase